MARAGVTTSRLDGVPVVQCRLEALDEHTLTEVVGEAWGRRAPHQLVAGWISGR